MRIGFDHYTIEHRGLSAAETLEFARDRELGGVQFLEPSMIDRDMNPERLAGFRRQADRMGLYVEVGIPSPNPVRRSRLEDRVIEPPEHARELRRHLEAVAALGCHHARAYIGDRHDRFRTDTRWEAQKAASLEVLRQLAPVLRDLKLRVAIETHADLTADELFQFVDRLGTDVAGVTLDTGNLPMRLDDPMTAAQRLAPLVLGTHLKDAVLAFTPRGLCWQARPVGSGIVPIPDILAVLQRANPALALSIELHPRTYDLPIYDRTWLAFFPDLRPESLAGVVRLAAECERRYAEGLLEPPERVEAVPWPDRDLDWLARSAGYLRTVVDLLGRL
jgi:sugar phosphate isomerase/epimerase